MLRFVNLFDGQMKIKPTSVIKVLFLVFGSIYHSDL
jgi:hypothetical protein